MKTNNNTHEIEAFIIENKNLFWWIPEKDKTNISNNLLVETILNFGNEESVRKLFDLIGIKQVARIFYQQTQRQRINYHPRTINFFRLYFKKHA